MASCDQENSYLHFPFCNFFHLHLIVLAVLESVKFCLKTLFFTKMRKTVKYYKTSFLPLQNHVKILSEFLLKSFIFDAVYPLFYLNLLLLHI